MQFREILRQRTEPDRQQLFAAPVIQDALRGDVITAQYVAFLTQAYRHVKHTVPLLMACGSRLEHDYGWLRDAVAEYIEEELGHEERILSDIAPCGGNLEQARHSLRHSTTELMAAYSYHQIDRRNPVSFFGMVHALEGTSTALDTRVADTIRRTPQLPHASVSYLSSHCNLDPGHVVFFDGLMNRLEREADRETVIHCARMFDCLYGNMFRSLPRRADLAQEA